MFSCNTEDSFPQIQRTFINSFVGSHLPRKQSTTLPCRTGKSNLSLITYKHKKIMVGFVGQLCKTLQKRASGDDKKCMEKESYLNRYCIRWPKVCDLLNVTPLANEKTSQQSLNMQVYLELGRSLLLSLLLGLRPVAAASVRTSKIKLRTHFTWRIFPS